jgi:hypothetical protein
MVQKLSSLTMVTTEFRSPGLEPKGSEFMGTMLVYPILAGRDKR